MVWLLGLGLCTGRTGEMSQQNLQRSLDSIKSLFVFVSAFLVILGRDFQRDDGGFIVGPERRPEF